MTDQCPATYSSRDWWSEDWHDCDCVLPPGHDDSDGHKCSHGCEFTCPAWWERADEAR